jgi:hypothetical protein
MALLRNRVGDSLINTPLTLVLRRPDGVAAKRFSTTDPVERTLARPLYLQLWFLVLVAIVIGSALGHFLWALPATSVASSLPTSLRLPRSRRRQPRQ